ncbi:Ets-domain family protein [Brugia pahangi]
MLFSDRKFSAFSVHIPRPIPISSQHTDITSHANQFNPAFIYPSVHLPCPQTRTDYLPANDSQQQACIAEKHTAISPVAPIAAAAFNPSLMCLPALFDHFGGEILRTHMNPAATQFKPIPNNERVDLTRFLSKEPQEWTMGDVIAWLLHVARQNGIPFEDLEMQKFANCTGMMLIQMREIDFKQRDAVYGSLLYAEFRKLLIEERLADECVYKLPEKASTCRVPDDTRLSCISSGLSPNTSTLSSLLMPDSNLISSSSMQPLDTLSQVGSDVAGTFNFNSPIGSDETFMLRPTYCKVRKNKDGRPRKHSQHTKGNKLWEFIRDALKDPSTCPSVVRWEDPAEGVFRIVESEKLAQLWGERKNNQKMTYEKLSRAMRTYYEKRILVPVPKTGLYPKKLVYKFGPSALG